MRELRRRARRRARRARLSVLRAGRGRENAAWNHVTGALAADVALEEGFLTMGRGSYGEPLVHVFPGERASVTVGQFCSIAPGVEFMLGGQHRHDWLTTFPLRARYEIHGAYADGHPKAPQGIDVRNDVWLASQALILDGVTIGDGAVVAARAVVTRDVRPYSIVAGNPAREVGRRFPDDVVDLLLATKWWDWELSRILASVDVLCSEDYGALGEEDAS